MRREGGGGSLSRYARFSSTAPSPLFAAYRMYVCIVLAWGVFSFFFSAVSAALLPSVLRLPGRYAVGDYMLGG